MDPPKQFRVRLVDEIKPAADVVRELMEGARQILSRLAVHGGG